MSLLDFIVYFIFGSPVVVTLATTTLPVVHVFVWQM